MDIDATYNHYMSCISEHSCYNQFIIALYYTRLHHLVTSGIKIISQFPPIQSNGVAKEVENNV